METIVRKDLPCANPHLVEGYIAISEILEGYGTVLRAYWQGVGEPVKLSVDWDEQTLAMGALTDSEHVTLVRS